MTVEFKLPLISEGVEAADIAAVHVHEGDTVEAGQILFEVETEKAVAEIPSPQAGRIGKIHVKQGQTVKIGEPLLTIDEAGSAGGESKAPAAAAASEKKPAEQKPAPKKPAAEAASAVEEEKTKQPGAARGRRAEESRIVAGPGRQTGETRRGTENDRSVGTPRGNTNHRRLANGRRRQRTRRGSRTGRTRHTATGARVGSRSTSRLRVGAGWPDHVRRCASVRPLADHEPYARHRRDHDRHDAAAIRPIWSDRAPADEQTGPFERG